MTDPKDYLRQMVDHTIAGDSEAASDAFRNYLVPKTMDVLGIKGKQDAEKVKAEPEAVEAKPAAEPKAKESKAE